MSWVTVIWSMVASACFTLATVYLLVWCRRRTTWSYLLFAVAALATAVVAGCELCLMRPQTPGQLAALVRWLHVPIWVVIVATVGFVRLHLRAGRRWLAWSTCALRTASLLANFLVGQNLNYLEITRVRRVPFLGDTVSLAEGVVNPWMLVGQLSLVCYFAFAVDAAITVWRRGNGPAALLVGSSFAFFVLVGGVEAALVVRGVLQWPFTMSLPFLGIVAAMAYELTRDVLRSAQLADDLRASESRYHGIFDGAMEGMFRTSVQGRYLLANAAMIRMLGYDSSEEAEREMRDAAHQVWAEPEARVRHLRRVEAEGFVRAEECLFKRRDGTRIWVSLSTRAVRGPDGQVAYFDGFVEDISERRRAEQEVGRQREQLAHVARVATVSQLASSLAHELNQPLGAILRNAEAAEIMLQESSPNIEEVRTVLQDIQSDDQRAGAVIDRMRALMKRRDVNRVALDLGQLAGDAIALARPDADRRHVALALETVPTIAPVQGDRVQLQQVLLNLLLNAMDALGNSPPHEGRVTVRVRRAAAAVEVSVCDNGPGIPADGLPRLFEPFYTTKPGGLGIGLPISKSIVEAHGGRLWAENTAGGGATFTFVLPVAEGEKGR